MYHKNGFKVFNHKKECRVWGKILDPAATHIPGLDKILGVAANSDIRILSNIPVFGSTLK